MGQVIMEAGSRQSARPGPLGEWETLTEDDEWAFFVHLGLDLPDK